MDENEVIERYRISRKAYICKKELARLADMDSVKLINEVWGKLRKQILDYLKTIDKELEHDKYLPTDLVFKFLPNQRLQRQIEKDYADLMKYRYGDNKPTANMKRGGEEGDE